VALGDVTDREQVTRAALGNDVIVHLASLLHLNNPTPDQEAEIERVNVVGTQNVVHAGVEHGARRLVFISTIAVYGYQQGGTYTEQSPTLPETVYGRTKLAAESVALSAHGADGTKLATVLRLAAVYGPRIKGNYQTLLRALARGRFVPIGSGTNRRTLVHADDVAQAVCFAARDDVPVAGEIFNVTDGVYHELRSILAAMCAALGRHPPRFSVPLFAARMLTRAFDGLLKLAGRRPRLSLLVDKYVEEVRVDGAKLRDIGFQSKVALSDGWAQTVKHLRKDGALGA
jgi:UDP-glucose 4-epimerase